VKVYLVRQHEMQACVDCGTADVLGVFLARPSADRLVVEQGLAAGGGRMRYVVEEWDVRDEGEVA
jgi:hypothetical protein